MAELSNRALGLLVLAALVVVIVGTSLQLTGNTITGNAPTDTGTVQLAINASLHIEVNSSEADIDFGTCSTYGTIYTVDSNSSVANGNCSGTAATGLDFIQVINVGNINASVNVTGECTPAELLPEASGSSNDFEIMINGSCSGGISTTAYTTLSTSPLVACSNMSTASSFYMFARATIDTDTETTGSCGGDTTNTLTFSAISAE